MNKRNLYPILGIFFFLFNPGLSQSFSADSLSGFDVNKAVRASHEHGCFGKETKVYVSRAKREFIKTKYNLNTWHSNQVHSVKFNPATITNAPCVDEDFEGLTTGSLVSSAWVSQICTNSGSTSVPCGTLPLTYTANNTYAHVVSTPVSDPQCGNVAASPFGGTKILSLNRNNFTTIPTRVAQTFSVTSSNFIYNYAYMGVLNVAGNHSCCEQPAIFFNFYDCANNAISSMSLEILSNNCTNPNPDAAYWAVNTLNTNLQFYYTPNWVMHSVNLSAYTGSCITVEIIAVGCMFTGHDGYLYYDAVCSNSVIAPGIIYTNGNSIGSYSACIPAYTLSSVGGLSSYLWQGPINSGINGSTLSTVTTSVPGTYTLSGLNVNVPYSQTVSLGLYNTQTLSINTATTTLCNGSSAVLFANPTGLTSYTWSNAANTSSIAISPSSTSSYSVIATNSMGCLSLPASTTITVLPPWSTFISPVSPTFCSGVSHSITATSNTQQVAYNWSNGANGPVIQVNPTVTTMYSYTATNAAGCQLSDSTWVYVLVTPQIQVTLNNDTTCAGDYVTLTANANSALYYNWAFYHYTYSITMGSNNQTIFTYPIQSTTFSLTVYGTSGCNASTLINVFVKPAPTVTLVPSSSVFCFSVPVTISANGNGISTYNWSFNNIASTITTSSVVVKPVSTVQYMVVVSNSVGCQASSSITKTVTPVVGQLNFDANSYSICAGEFLSLTTLENNILSRMWSTGDTNQVIVVNPTFSTSYTVTAKDNNGCMLTKSLTVSVDACTGLSETAINTNQLRVIPNPSDGSFVIKSFNSSKLFIYNSLGQLVREIYPQAEQDYFLSKITGLSKGVYYASSLYEPTLKIIVE